MKRICAGARKQAAPVASGRLRPQAPQKPEKSARRPRRARAAGVPRGNAPRFAGSRPVHKGKGSGRSEKKQVTRQSNHKDGGGSIWVA